MTLHCNRTNVSTQELQSVLAYARSHVSACVFITNHDCEPRGGFAMLSVMIRKSSRVEDAAQKRLRLEGGNQISKAGKRKNVTLDGESMVYVHVQLLNNSTFNRSDQRSLRMGKGSKYNYFRFCVTDKLTNRPKSGL